MDHVTKHAKIRCQQRGITKERLANFLAVADIEVPAARGCCTVRASRAVIRNLPGGEKLATVALIISADGAIVTAKHCYFRRRSWRYSSGYRRHRQYKR